MKTNIKHEKNNSQLLFKIPSLDGWRAVAILIVFLSHIGLGGAIPGGLGVTIFFFLSGYLITTLMCNEYDRNATISIRRFYLRRILRLSPPLIITLVLSYTFTYFDILKGGISLQGFTAQLFYFANYYFIFFDVGNTTPAGTGVFWSLAVEEHFYFVFPFIFLSLLNRTNKRTLIVTLVFLCIATLAWRIILVTTFASSAYRTYYSTDTRIDSIIYGCLLALIKNPLKDTNSERNLSSMEWLIIGMSFLTIVITLLFRNIIFRETFRYSIQGIALAPLFYYSIRQYESRIFAPLNWKFMKTLGKYSYSMYLVHFILIENVLHIAQSMIPSIILIIAITIVYAIFIDKFIDTPLQAIKAHFR